VRKIVVPAAWKTASKERVRFDPRSRMKNRKSSNRSVHRQVAGLLHRPVTGRVGGDPAHVHPASAVLGEYQHVPPV